MAKIKPKITCPYCGQNCLVTLHVTKLEEPAEPKPEATSNTGAFIAICLVIMLGILLGYWLRGSGILNM